MNPRIPLVVLVAGSCLYCSGSPQREDRTTVNVGGGYVRAGESAFGCGGNLISTQDHRQRVGSVGVEHESESGWSGAAEVAAAQGELLSYTAAASAGQPALAPNPRLQEYPLIAGHLRGGIDLSWIGAELGGTAVGGAPPLPYGLLRFGNLANGVSAELQAGRRRALADPTVASLAVAYKAPQLRVRAALAATGRALLTYRQSGTTLVRDRVVIGSFSDDLDTGLLLEVETWLDHGVAVRMGAVLGDSWGGTIDLVIALSRKVPKITEEWRGGVHPMPGRPPASPAPAPVASPDHPPLAEPVSPSAAGPDRTN